MKTLSISARLRTIPKKAPAADAVMVDVAAKTENVKKVPVRRRDEAEGRENENLRDELSLKDRVASDPTFHELKVSSKTETKRLAGALAHMAREQKEIKILAISPQNMNTAIKAVAVARDYVKDDGIDVGVVLRFRSDEKHAIDMRYVTFDARFDMSQSDSVYAVSKNTKPSAAAGAVAARLR